MRKVGIVGLGFMGKMHFRCYQALESAQIVAVCDIDPKKLEGGAGEAGNVAGAEEPLDLSEVKTYTDFDKMISECDLDAVSITLPTYLHCQYTTKVLEAGLNVLCEKPMALDIDQCDKMINASEKSGKLLQVGHCIRFWPEYAKTRDIIKSGKYGNVQAATFQRLSMTPAWAWDNWILDDSKSGGALLDLHIHDADFVHYLFGLPKSVFTRAAKGPSGGFDHVVTNYLYADEQVITAEGGWIMTNAFGFRMNFHIILEKADIIFDITRDPIFNVLPAEGEAFTPEVAQGDGYSIEIAHFVDKITGNTDETVLTPQQSKDSVMLVLKEKQSAASGKEVTL